MVYFAVSIDTSDENVRANRNCNRESTDNRSWTQELRLCIKYWETISQCFLQFGMAITKEERRMVAPIPANRDGKNPDESPPGHSGFIG